MKYIFSQSLTNVFRIIARAVLAIAFLLALTSCAWQTSDVAENVLTVKLSKPPMQAFWHPDNKRFGIQGFGTLGIWDVTTGEQASPPIPFWIGTSSVIYSPDGRFLVVHKIDEVKNVGEDSVVLLDARDHHVVREFPNLRLIEYGGSFSPDSRYLLAIGHNKARHIATVLDMKTGEIVAELDALTKNTNLINRAIYSPDGSLVILGFISGDVGIWSTKDWHLIQKFRAQEGFVGALAISPSGKWLATGSNQVVRSARYPSGEPVTIWDTATWEKVVELPPHTSKVDSLAFLLDGKHLLVNNDKEIVFLDIQTTKRVGSIRAFNNAYRLNFSLSPNGQYLAVVGMESGKGHVWKITGDFIK